ncbi:MAG: hypothetical protein ACPHN2_12735 [Sinimarinibacterium flocculans]|uniref:hypothetical protein n=1 Tax=Sinimarinibacterium flocculans TaxID=985250 RepID=UPI0035170905
MASFLVDGTNWPTEARPFKITNLLIHIFNGLALFVLLQKLGKRLGWVQPVWAALAGAGFWLLHPLQLSTVLYVVQRMTELSTLFTILGLIVYVQQRERAANGNLLDSVRLLTVLALVTAAATLSKENGILLPALVLCLELTVFAATAPVGPWRYARWALFLPVAAAAAIIVVQWDRFEMGYMTREFTPSQRMLTEPRVVLGYLSTILLPRPSDVTLFHDFYRASTSLWAPPETALAVVLLAGLTIAAIGYRKRFPVISAAWLFFLVAHSLEASPIPLELAFDHRNYLPLVGLALAVAWLVNRWLPSHNRIVLMLLGCVMVLFSAQIWVNARIWGNLQIASAVWPIEHPESPRAHQASAAFYSSSGDFASAREILLRGYAQRPDASWLLLLILQMECRMGVDAAEGSLPLATEQLPSTPYNRSTLDTLDRIVELKATGMCQRFSPDDIHRLIAALSQNPQYASINNARAQLYFIDAQLLAFQSHPAEAAEKMALAYQSSPKSAFLYWQVIYRAAAYQFDLAERALNEWLRVESERTFGSDTTATEKELRELIAALRQASEKLQH